MEKSTHTSEYRSLCGTLRHARQAADLSQRDLADRLKVTHSWVAKVETGERRIDLVEFYWFLSACGVDPATAIPELLRKFPRRAFARGSKGGRT
jgi:transcriptional regulator with XRE-family HTH domain